MAEREVLGNIGLGNFCKAVLDHKGIEINGTDYFYNVSNNQYGTVDFIGSYVHYYGTPEEFISLFIDSIYKLQVSFKIGG